MGKQNRRKFIKNAVFLAATPAISIPVQEKKKQVNLIVRADDMGMSHAANLGCLEAYRKGVVRSVEVMVPCPWFPEAAEMLQENPGLDPGLHLTLNSEWTSFRWRPLTLAPSLVDEEFNFYRGFSQPKSDKDLPNTWKPDEVEKELRAQIELGLKKIPHTSHLSDHMFFSKRSPVLEEMMVRLAEEYALFYDIKRIGLDYAGKYRSDDTSYEGRLHAMKQRIDQLEPGTWIIITHPSAGTEEAHAIRGSSNDIGQKRDMSRKILTAPELISFCEEMGINLMAYKDI